MTVSNENGKHKQNCSFEAMDAVLVSCSVTIRVIIIYQVPPSQQNEIKRGEFLEECKALLEMTATSFGKLILLGDFNVH